MDKASYSASVSIIAGGVAGASESFITYPAEFVKTRRQLQNSSFSQKPASSWAILQQTFRETGIRGIYSGCQTLALSNALKSGVRFWTFEQAKRTLTPYFGRSKSPSGAAQNPLLNFIAGLCAGVTESVLVVTPGEALKTRVIHDASSGGSLNRLSVPQLMGHVIRQEGVSSLWRGLTPVVCKQGTNSAVRFTTFGTLRDKLTGFWPQMNVTTATMLAGAGSGIVTVYASMPFDNVKTRMQSIGNPERRMISVASQMLASEGVLVFWRATTPRLVRLTLSSSIAFMVYDYSIRMLGLLTLNRIDSTAIAET